MLCDFNAATCNNCPRLEVVWDQVNVRRTEWRIERLELSGYTSYMSWDVRGKKHVETEQKLPSFIQQPSPFLRWLAGLGKDPGGYQSG